MGVIMIELLLWVGLIFFFWAMRSRLHQIESEIETLGLFQGTPNNAGLRPQFDLPERLYEAIGSYMDAPIYRFAVFGGKQYQFDSVCPAGSLDGVQPSQRCIRPGLLYRPCNSQN